MTQYSKAFFGIAEDQYFNLPAAIDAYEWVLRNPEEAPFVVSKALFDHTTREMEANKATIERVSKAYVNDRIDTMRRGLSRSVSKSESAAKANEMLELISKALGQDKYNRNKLGQFWATESRGFQPVKPGTKPKAKGQIDPIHLSSSQGLSHELKAQFQSDLDTLSTFLREAVVNPMPGENFVQARAANGLWGPPIPLAEAVSAVRDGDPNTGLLQVGDYKDGVRIDEVGIFNADSVKPSGAAPAAGGSAPATREKEDDGAFDYDALTAAGMDPRFTQYAHAGNKALGPWQHKGPRDAYTNEQMWRRLQAGSQLALDIGGPAMPDNAKLALMTAKWTGQFAPEAEKVIGPTARRSGYRYRGVEKKPSPAYQEYINTLRQRFPTGRQAHDVMINGEERRIPVNPRDPSRGTRLVYQPSVLVERLRKTLPDPNLYHLNRKSGVIPPSQGIIVDRSGKVVTEAVGYGEDWYLPFNLKNLSRLKGGEYVRTRAFGGPTTEDIYVGLVGGARAVTVVSHSGVFTIEFDDTFRGSRRYNDKAGRMHARYAQLLDAVKSKDVTMGAIPKERMLELREQAGSRYSPDDQNEEYVKEFRRLQLKEREYPKLARALEEQKKVEVLDEYVRERQLARDYNDYVIAMENASKANGTWDEAKGKYATPDAALETFGMTRAATKAVDIARAEYEQSMNPLTLNGTGYAAALNALKDQFPYYITAVHHTDYREGQRDEGYVKPRFIRPEGALAGYYDPSIQGMGERSGKFTADQTNYQNYPVTQGGLRLEETKGVAPKKEGAAGAAGATPAKPGGSTKYAKADSLIALVENARKQTKVSSSFRDSALAGQELDAGGRNQLLAQAPDVFGGDIATLRSKLYNDPDGTFYAKVDQQIKKLRVNNFIDLDSELVGNYERGGEFVAVEKPNDPMAVLTSLGKQVYNAWPDLKPGRNAAHYQAQIDRLTVPGTGNPAVLAMNLQPDTTAKDAIAKANEQAERLQRIYRIHMRIDDGQVIERPPTSKVDIVNSANALAQITQAYILRDQAKKLEEEASSVNAPEAPNVVVVNATPEQAAQIAAGEPLPKSSAPEQGAAEETHLNPEAAQIRDRIHGMIGMRQVANEVDSLVAGAIQGKRREEAGLPNESRSMHLVFEGNPGTGKTTIARQLAPLYHQLGLIPSDMFKEVSRADLVGGYQGQTAMKVQRVFDEAKGGVLFIDEAYSLKQGEGDSYGQEAIDTLMANIENHRNDTVVILAGYPAQMDTFLQQNPGMRSRFPKRVSFPDYTKGDLVQISGRMMDEGGYAATKPGVKALVKHAVGQLVENPAYANARDVRNLYERITEAQNMRLSHTPAPSRDQLQEITASDVRHAMREMGISKPAPRRRVSV